MSFPYAFPIQGVIRIDGSLGFGGCSIVDTTGSMTVDGGGIWNGKTGKIVVKDGLSMGYSNAISSVSQYATYRTRGEQDSGRCSRLSSLPPLLGGKNDRRGTDLQEGGISLNIIFDYFAKLCWVPPKTR